MTTTNPPSDLAPLSSKPHRAPTVVSPELIPDRRGAVAFMSSVTRKGDWILPREFRIASCMGNVELDLTSVQIGRGESTIDIRCIFGNVEITVPPDIRVDVEGDPFVGSFELKRSAQSTVSPDAPLVRIKGSVILGAVSIEVVDPNAPGWFEKIRVRLKGR